MEKEGELKVEMLHATMTAEGGRKVTLKCSWRGNERVMFESVGNAGASKMTFRSLAAALDVLMRQGEGLEKAGFRWEPRGWLSEEWASDVDAALNVAWIDKALAKLLREKLWRRVGESVGEAVEASCEML